MLLWLLVLRHNVGSSSPIAARCAGLVWMHPRHNSSRVSPFSYLLLFVLTPVCSSARFIVFWATECLTGMYLIAYASCLAHRIWRLRRTFLDPLAFLGCLSTVQSNDRKSLENHFAWRYGLSHRLILTCIWRNTQGIVFFFIMFATNLSLIIMYIVSWVSVLLQISLF